jgi:hypothetical protein
MTVKLLRRDSKKTRNNNTIDVKVVQKKRGRPKGSKNKPKSIPATSPVKRRGRPKGSKNKPKEVTSVVSVAPVEPPKKPRVSARVEKSTRQDTPKPATKQGEQAHPLVSAVQYLEKYMSPQEAQYYQRRASRLNLPARSLMVQDILSIFNIQDAELKKTLKAIVV